MTLLSSCFSDTLQYVQPRYGSVLGYPARPAVACHGVLPPLPADPTVPTKPPVPPMPLYGKVITTSTKYEVRSTTESKHQHDPPINLGLGYGTEVASAAES